MPFTPRSRASPLGSNALAIWAFASALFPAGFVPELPSAIHARSNTAASTPAVVTLRRLPGLSAAQRSLAVSLLLLAAISAPHSQARDAARQQASSVVPGRRRTARSTARVLNGYVAKLPPQALTCPYIQLH